MLFILTGDSRAHIIPPAIPATTILFRKESRNPSKGIKKPKSSSVKKVASKLSLRDLYSYHPAFMMSRYPIFSAISAPESSSYFPSLKVQAWVHPASYPTAAQPLESYPLEVVVIIS